MHFKNKMEVFHTKGLPGWMIWKTVITDIILQGRAGEVLPSKFDNQNYRNELQCWLKHIKMVSVLFWSNLCPRSLVIFPTSNITQLTNTILEGWEQLVYLPCFTWKSGIMKISSLNCLKEKKNGWSWISWADLFFYFSQLCGNLICLCNLNG